MLMPNYWKQISPMNKSHGMLKDNKPIKCDFPY